MKAETCDRAWLREAAKVAGPILLAWLLCLLLVVIVLSVTA